MENSDRITELRVKGMRAIREVRLPLSRLMVLIGENGSGKSSLIEALELLRKTTLPVAFVPESFVGVHGGLPALLRVGSQQVSLGATIEGGGDALEYDLSIGREGNSTVLTRETLVQRIEGGAKALPIIDRDRSKCAVYDAMNGSTHLLSLNPGQLALTAFGAVSQQALSRTIGALGTTEVHVPFETEARWIVRQGMDANSGIRRGPAAFESAQRLAILGTNLSSCIVTLKEQRSPEKWAEVVQRIREGLAPEPAVAREGAVAARRSLCRSSCSPRHPFRPSLGCTGEPGRVGHTVRAGRNPKHTPAAS